MAHRRQTNLRAITDDERNGLVRNVTDWAESIDRGIIQSDVAVALRQFHRRQFEHAADRRAAFHDIGRQAEFALPVRHHHFNCGRAFAGSRRSGGWHLASR